MSKAPEAFRTISEVAAWLDTPAHVLRFWESRFPEVRPVKRAGGRRYYRPGDMRLLGGIKHLLHDRGMTIRGVQKLLREEGIAHVAAYSQPLDTVARAGESAELTPGEASEIAAGAAAPMEETARAATPAGGAGREADAPAKSVGDDGQEAPARDEAEAARADGHEPPPPAPAPADEAEGVSAEAQAGAPPGGAPPGGATEKAPSAPAPPRTPDHAGPPADTARAAPEPAAPDQSDLFARPGPLGADLPASDPTLLDITLPAPPLAARLRERATRRQLSRRHRETLAALLPRLRELADRMDAGAGD